MHASDWLTTHGVTFDWSANGYHADPDGWEHQRFTLKLTSPQGATVAIPWRQGLGIESDPSADDLWAVASDVRCGLMSWAAFAGEYGYDENEAPLSEYRTWEACQTLVDEMAALCDSLEGDAFAQFLDITEDGE